MSSGGPLATALSALRSRAILCIPSRRSPIWYPAASITLLNLHLSSLSLPQSSLPTEPKSDFNMVESEPDSSNPTHTVHHQQCPAQPRPNGTTTPMNINLNGVQNPLNDSSKVSNGAVEHHLTCPHCVLTIDVGSTPVPVEAKPEPMSSSLVVPAAAAYESGMSAVEEFKLLKAQVLDVARVCNAVARGDLSQKITVPVQGVVMVQLKEVINTMVNKLGQFAEEVTSRSRNRRHWCLMLKAPGVNVNYLAANLTNQAHSIAEVSKAVARGDLSQQIDVNARGENFGTQHNAAEVTRVTLEVGREAQTGGQAHVPDIEGVWLELTRNVSCQSDVLVAHEPSAVHSTLTTPVAKGHLTQKIEIEGEMLTLKRTVNSMVDQLSAFASEVIRVALEVGTQGVLGGQATVEGVQGTWADLTRNVNKMASNLKKINRREWDLSRTVDVDVRGEMLELKTTVNQMVAHFSSLASAVIRVSFEVGTEGKTGGQAIVPNVPGMWKVLADNVNLMVMNLTNQVRSIAEVNKAVASGDLTKRITPARCLS
ncbi:hypothetical protein K474DRAFT_1728124 [Panus rudis PR-1116 ss-1]|nr:hypothetical protein K474DRAFT_1728124 [Panus rudis PR-1116 ss-1]